MIELQEMWINGNNLTIITKLFHNCYRSLHTPEFLLHDLYNKHVLLQLIFSSMFWIVEQEGILFKTHHKFAP